MLVFDNKAWLIESSLIQKNLILNICTMKNTILLLLFTISCQLTVAQNAAVATGGIATGSGGSFSYSVGQIADKFATSANGSLSEGLQQPFEILTLGTDNYPNIILEMSVYPNPTKSNVTLKIADLDSENLGYQIFDVAGKQISEAKISNIETQISLENLNASIYFLNINDNKKTIKTFKIIKK